MNGKTWMGVLLLVALDVGAVPAATLTVDASGGTPYQTIQSAITAAVAGQDQVLVRCGVYHENVVMKDQVTVTGLDPRCTVIDGGANGSSAVRIVQIGASTQLRGFTIRNGRSGFGGGIYLEASSATITGNVITGNSAVVSGGKGGLGGGIHVTSPAGLLADTKPVITNNIIRGNHAELFGGGIEMYSDAGSLVAGNLIAENIADQAGGGIDMYQSFPTIIHNTVVRNCRQGTGTPCVQGGGGLSLSNSGVVNIANNLIAWNEAGTNGGGVDLAGASSATFASNDAFANLPTNYAGVANPTGTSGNISTDPLLVDEAYGVFRGFQPRSNSPLIDAASPAPLAPDHDLGGIPRPWDGNADGSAVPDIGARENEGITALMLPSKTALSWNPSIVPTALFNLYRGDLQTLRATGIYMQDTATVVGARRQCGLLSASATDADLPAAGKVFFYLATIKNSVEGTLGFNGAAVERPPTAANHCP